MIGLSSNAERLRSFQTDGFVALAQFVSVAELTELLAHVDRFIRDIVPQLPPEQVFYEDKHNPATLKQIQHMRDQARTKTLGFSQGIVDYPTDQDREAEIAFPAKPGDLLVHDALTIHRADGNQSPTRSRRALGFIYYSNRARENVEAHAAYQRRLAEVKIARRI